MTETYARDEFLSDGSKRNKSMLAATRPYRPMEHDWEGMFVAVAMGDRVLMG